MTYFVLLLAILVWPFGQLLNISLPGLDQILYPLDLICALLTLSLLFSSKKRQVIFHDPLFKPLVIFLFVAAFSLLLNFRSAIAGGLSYSIFYLVRLIIYPSVYFSAKLSAGKKVLPYVWLSLLTFSFIGLMQYLFFPDMRFLKLLGFDDHYFRLIGSFYDPNFSGAIFAALALVLVTLSQWLVSLPIILLLALTFSRASYLVFILGLIYICFAKKHWEKNSNSPLSSSRRGPQGPEYYRGRSIWTIFSYLLVLICLILLAPKPFGEGVNLLRTFSIFSRFDSWQAGLHLFLQKPLFGWGYNTLRSIGGVRFQIDNSFLYLAATTGAVGLLAFFNLIKSVFQITKAHPQRIFLLALLAHSLFNNSLFYIWIYFAFWLVLGIRSKEYKES